MRRTLISALLAGVAVPSFAALAVADQPGPSTQAVSASFTATAVSYSSSRSCTGADGSYLVSRARYTGTASSTDPSLDGRLVIDAESVFNQSKDLGWVRGKLWVIAANGTRTKASLVAVDNGNELQGFVRGTVHSPGNAQGNDNAQGDEKHGDKKYTGDDNFQGDNSESKLLGGFSSGFTSTGGFTNGEIGAGTAILSALVFSGPACQS